MPESSLDFFFSVSKEGDRVSQVHDNHLTPPFAFSPSFSSVCYSIHFRNRKKKYVCVNISLIARVGLRR